MQKKKGFTLIELLVVIAIIAILAAILFPVFARARENARRASCQSNLKQLALGVFQYTQDYDEKYPTVTGVAAANVTTSNPYGWADALQPYLKSTQLFQCPSETGAPIASTNAAPATGSYLGTVDPRNTQYTDYWFNSILGGQSQAAIEAVAQTIMNGDGYGNVAAATTSTSSIGTSQYNYNGCAYDGTACTYTATDTFVTSASGQGTPSHFGRHLDGANYAFADGHVKWLKGNGSTIDRSSAIRNSAWTSAQAGGNAYFGRN